MEENVWEENIQVNPAQASMLLTPYKNGYYIFSRATGKSFICGAVIDDNVRVMPRGVTTLAQATIGQALTKTLPSSFKMLEMLGYKRYDTKTKTGDYVVCRTPPDGWYRPYEHLMSYEHCITFSNGHCLYILTQEGNSRGPNADYNITDEALTIDKEQFDQEVAPTNRGNEHIFGKKSAHPIYKHHGNTFLSSMPYTPEQKWLLEPAAYYEEERGVRLFDVWNKIVRLQMQLIDAKIANDSGLFRDIWNETMRLRQTITPFVSKDGTLFMLASIFDNISNIGMNYIVNQYNVMDRLSFMIEILNYFIERIDSCYYQLDERHVYYNATDDSYIKDFAENSDYNWEQLAKNDDSRRDLDCNAMQPLEITCDWGSRASFMEVGQTRNYDFVTKQLTTRTVENNINEFFVHPEDDDDVMVISLMKKFVHYYRNHVKKVVHFYRDRYGDIRQASSKKTYNQTAIDYLQRNGWEVIQHVHQGIEPPQHDKYLLWGFILTEKDERFPIKRFNGTKCKYTLISMNNTRVIEREGKFAKDKRSERNQSVLPEEATHFGDAVDKRMWTKYGHLLKSNYGFVDARVYVCVTYCGYLTERHSRRSVGILSHSSRRTAPTPPPCRHISLHY